MVMVLLLPIVLLVLLIELIVLQLLNNMLLLTMLLLHVLPVVDTNINVLLVPPLKLLLMVV